MIKQIYSIYDSKAEVYSPTFTANNNGDAIRAFQNDIQKGQSMLATNPEDFTLFHLGEWDDEKGKYIMVDAPLALGRAIEYTNKES